MFLWVKKCCICKVPVNGSSWCRGEGGYDCLVCSVQFCIIICTSWRYRLQDLVLKSRDLKTNQVM